CHYKNFREDRNSQAGINRVLWSNFCSSPAFIFTTYTTLHMNYRLLFFALFAGLMAVSCKKTTATFDPPTEAKVIFVFKFDSTQMRLNNVGEEVDVAPGHAAQNLKMKAISSHYIELAQS